MSLNLDIPYFKKYGESTGGPLNPISELKGRLHSLTGARYSISLNKLKDKHPEIKFNEQMWSEVDRHYHEDCECGLKSKGTIEMVAQSIFEAQNEPKAQEILKKKGDKENWDFNTVQTWVKLLFGRNTLQGQGMEEQAIKDLSKDLWRFELKIADDELDKKYCVDIVVKNKVSKEIVGGIQVKPKSYYNTGIDHVTQANKKWDYPVYHLKYDDMESKNWLNRLEVLSKFI